MCFIDSVVDKNSLDQPNFDRVQPLKPTNSSKVNKVNVVALAILTILGATSTLLGISAAVGGLIVGAAPICLAVAVPGIITIIFSIALGALIVKTRKNSSPENHKNFYEESKNPVNNTSGVEEILIDKAIKQSALPPVGIKNSGTDCYFSCAIQYIMNTPSFLEAISRVSVTQKKGSLFYKELIKSYQSCQREKRTMPTDENSAYRKFKQYLNNKYGGICPDGEQQDFPKVLSYLIKDIGSFGVKSPLYRNMYIPKTKEIISEIDLFTYADDPETEYGKGIVEQYTDPESKEISFMFNTAPSSIAINENDGMHCNPLSLVLPQEVISSHVEQDATYESTYLGIHMGSPSFGHWFCLLKVNGLWYLVNDDHVQLVNEEQTKNIYMENGCSLNHFSRL